MTEDGTVPVAGGTGMLGNQVVAQLPSRGKPVRTLVRPGSDAIRLEAAGASIARGTRWTLIRWSVRCAAPTSVISSAAGYTRHSKDDTTQIDAVGNSNLAEAANRTTIRRFVLTSTLTCDQTPDVPPFWHRSWLRTGSSN